MKTLMRVLLFCFLPLSSLLAQTPDEIAREANMEYTGVVDTSPRSVLWREMVEARKAIDINRYVTLKARYQQEYGHTLSRVVASPDDPYAVRPDRASEPAVPGDWGNGDVRISSAPVLSPLVAGNARSLRLRVDSLGNKYAAYISGNRDTLCVFRSTDEGLTWTRVTNVFPGGTTKWHSFDFYVTDSAAAHKLGFAATRTVEAGGFGGQLYWMSFSQDGSIFRASQIVNRPTGRGFVNPAIVSDGFLWSAALTYWYVAYQNVDSSTGVGNQALAALSADWGNTWTLDTVRNSFNDFDLDIDYNFGSDTILVLLTNDITPTNPNLRLMSIALGSFGTPTSWRQVNVAQTADPEFGGVLVSNRQNNALMVAYTRTQSSNDNIGYGYNSSGVNQLAQWMTDQILTALPNNEQRVDLDCQERQGAFRTAYVSKGPSRDTVIYYSAFTPPFGGRTIVNADRDASTSTAPSVAGFRVTSASFGGGVLFAGFGPTNLFYDGSNITPADVRPTGTLPDVFVLEQNYPNPFNPSTTIRFGIPRQSEVTLKVFDMLGREVATLLNDVKQAGTYDVTWNAQNLASGVYLYRLQAGQFTETRRMLLIK